MSAWDGLNRRKFPRVNFPCLVILKNMQNEAEALLTHTENIGIGGICVILKRQVKIFTPVEVELDLLDANNHIKCSGKIVWCVRRKSDEGKKPLFYDVGIEFADLKQDDHSRVEITVSNLEKKGLRTAYR